MNDAELQIVISLINNAAGQLTEVGDQLAGLGTQASEAAEQMSSSLSTAEEVAADAAIAAASQWENATDDITSAVETVGADADAIFANISDSALSAANAASEGWQQSLAEIQQLGTMTQEELDEAFSNIGEASEQAAATTGSSFSSMHSYFKGLIVAYSAERIGDALLGGVEEAVNAAAGNPQQIQQLTDEIDQQKASIASNEVELTKWTGTIAEVSAAHEKASADIAASTEKIQEYQQQLAPLLAEQQAGGEAATKYDQSVTTLNNDWQVFMATVGVQLLPLLTTLVNDIDEVVDRMTQWAEAHPKLTEAALIFTAALGGILIAVGALMAAFVIVIVTIGLLGGAFVATAAVITVAVAAAVALIATNWNLIRTETTQLISDFEAAWTAMATWWTNFWNGIFTTIDNVWNKVNTIINAIKAAIASVAGPVASIAGAVGGAVSSTLASVTHVQDAIITPNGVVQTDPADYLIATKTPGSLVGAGAGGGITININGGSYLDQGGATAIANALAAQINRQLKLKNYV